MGIGNFLQQADSAALNLASSQFAQGVGSFLNQVVSSGLAGSAFVQQQIVVLTGMASAGTTNSAAAQGLVGFLNNVYFGGTAAHVCRGQRDKCPSGRRWYGLVHLR